ncbi:MAG: hypothetical protein M3R25_03955 [Bacteroidota bacterium]|nr:hypothetical protein [Bacteroidota bacterium]
MWKKIQYEYTGSSFFRVVFIFITLLISRSGFGQVDCNSEYGFIHELQQRSHHIFYNDSIRFSKRIRLSKRDAMEALEYGRQVLLTKDCSNYSIIVDRMIELEMQIGIVEKARLLAETRIHKLYPDFMDYNANPDIDPEHVSCLAWMAGEKGSGNFYDEVRKNKGILGTCGSLDNSILLSTSRILRTYYGPIYAFRYLQHSYLDINMIQTKQNPLYGDIYDVLIESWSVFEPIDLIQNDFEAAPVDSAVSQLEYPVSDVKYFINVGKVPFYFYPEYNYKKRANMHPENPEEVKQNSLFYKRLKWHATLN